LTGNYLEVHLWQYERDVGIANIAVQPAF
jgi:hypothetical protein